MSKYYPTIGLEVHPSSRAKFTTGQVQNYE
jgi:hypothetical protein